MKSETHLKFRISARAFTMAEILVVIAIIAALLSVLLPALNQVKKVAKEAKQTAQITSIGMGIELYKNDFGYPPSQRQDSPPPADTYYYSGAQTLTEAMFGQDLLGYYPGANYDPCDLSSYYVPATIGNRRDPYLDRTNIDVFTPDDIFSPLNSNGLVPNRYVICDVFASASRTIGGKKRRVGTPVLYFKANTAETQIDVNDPNNNSNYNFNENRLLVEQGRVTDGKNHDGFETAGAFDKFYMYIKDPLASTPALKRPFRPDTFLLISAGYDGLYGTGDDICNFKPNFE